MAKQISIIFNLPSILNGNSVLARVDAGCKSDTDKPLALRYSGLKPRPANIQTKQNISRGSIINMGIQLIQLY